MKLKSLLWAALIGGTLFATGCSPVYGGRGYNNPYGLYEPYSGRGIYDPYYSTGSPYYPGGYDTRSPREIRRDLERGAHKADQKYDKAMNRLDRQERQAQEKALRKYDGNTSHPSYRKQTEKIDRKFDHKRDKVEHLRNKDYRKLDRDYDQYRRNRW